LAGSQRETVCGGDNDERRQELFTVNRSLKKRWTLLIIRNLSLSSNPYFVLQRMLNINSSKKFSRGFDNKKAPLRALSKQRTKEKLAFI
jgi:hypothetical protein